MTIYGMTGELFVAKPHLMNFLGLESCLFQHLNRSTLATKHLSAFRKYAGILIGNRIRNFFKVDEVFLKYIAQFDRKAEMMLLDLLKRE
jgi:hypothetical protein